MWLLLLMIMIMPFEQNPHLWISSSFLGIFPDFTVIKLLGLLGAGWALMRLGSGTDGERLLGARQVTLFLLFYSGIIVSGLISGSGFLAFSRYLAFMLFMPFVLVSVRTQDDLRRVVYAIVLAMMIVFPYALRQMWRFNARLGTAVYETNYFAANLLIVIPLAFVLAQQQKDTLRRVCFTAGAFSLVVALFLTSSRGGFLGLVVAGMTFVYRRRGFGAAVGLMMILVLAALPTGIGDRSIATWSGEADVGLDASNQAHTALFWAGIEMIKDAPLTGVGPNNFNKISNEYTRLGYGYIAHNTYLELGAEDGLPVLGTFLLLVTTVLASLKRSSRVDGSPEARELAGWADGMRTGLIGFLVAGAFISAEYEKWFWLVVFLSVVVERLAARMEAQALEESAAALPETSPEPAR